MLIGPNGAGKTTLLRARHGADPAHRAAASTWGGRDDAPPTRRAIVFQRPVMLRRSAAGNIGYALAAAGVPRARARRPRRRAAARWSASAGSASGRRAGSPAASSSGSRSRARSPRDPQVLFLDEPTASLDPAATKAVEDVIRAVAARGIKVVMSTHDLGEARRLAGEIVLLHRGRVVESGAGRGVLFRARRPRRRAASSPASCWSEPSTAIANEERTSCSTRRSLFILAGAAVVSRRRARAARRTNRSSSPRPPRRRTPACSATSCRCSRPRPAST